MSVARAPRPGTVRGLSLRGGFAKQIASVVCAALVVVTGTQLSACKAEEKVASKPAPSVSFLKALPSNKIVVQGPVNLLAQCPENQWKPPKVGTYDQVVRIAVGKNNDPKLLFYRVEILDPCLGVSRNGKVTFELWTEAGTPWNKENKVDVEFSLPLSSHKPVKGPFNRVGGEPKKRGIYEDVFNTRKPVVIPDKAIDPEILQGWTGGYTVKIWDPKQDTLLGEVDPGVKVIDPP
jgi:hypothetical protein